MINHLKLPKKNLYGFYCVLVSIKVLSVVFLSQLKSLTTTLIGDNSKLKKYLSFWHDLQNIQDKELMQLVIFLSCWYQKTVFALTFFCIA